MSNLWLEVLDVVELSQVDPSSLIVQSSLQTLEQVSVFLLGHSKAGIREDAVRLLNVLYDGISFALGYPSIQIHPISCPSLKVYLGKKKLHLSPQYAV